MFKKDNDNGSVPGTIFFFVLLLVFSVSVSDTFNGNGKVSDKTGNHIEYQACFDHSFDGVILSGSAVKNLVPEIIFQTGYNCDFLLSAEKYILSDFNRSTDMRITLNNKKRADIIPAPIWKYFFELASLHGESLPA